MRRSRRMVFVALVTASIVGCHIEEGFVRDNHWDSGTKARLVMLGPDSTFSIGDTFSVSLEADPPLPSGTDNFKWFAPGEADTAVHVYTAGTGRFYVGRANAGYRPVSVAVYLDNRVVGLEVMVGQKLASFQLLCGAVACDSTSVAVNANRGLNTIMRDANANDFRQRDKLMLRATFISRDPSVLSTAQTVANAAGLYQLRGVAPGTTWFVVSADGLTDSVKVVVTP